MVLATELEVGKAYKIESNNYSIGTYVKEGTMDTALGRPYDQLPPGAPKTAKVYYFTGCPPEKNGLYGVGEKQLGSVVEDTAGATCAVQGGRRRRTHRMLFKKWAAQEAREMSHKGKRMTFRKWAANELKEKSHPGNPSFKKWARQEMREKSHTRRRR
jgi:hypothetical protein